MPGSPILHMLLGAALVAIGVLAAALADRIRSLRASRETAVRVAALEGEAFSPQGGGPSGMHTDRRPASTAPIHHFTPAVAVLPVPPRFTAQSTNNLEDVIGALVAAGYKKQIAADAAAACSATEQSTIEDWTRAALRRCARSIS